MNGIAILREKCGLTQVELGRAVGVDNTTVCKWETGGSLPRAELLPKIADALGCRIDDLLMRSDEVKPYFIRVHRRHPDGHVTDYCLNANQIQTVCKDDDGCLVWINDYADDFYIEESYEDVLKMLGVNY